MLKIGEVSKLAQVTVKTLHHYHQVGLLKPALIDEQSQYRYYSFEQLSRLHRIMVLKELGLSLDQIAKVVDDSLTTEQLRGMLTLKQAEAQQLIDEEQARLRRIRFHLRQLEMEDHMLDIRIKKIEPMRALSFRTVLKNHREYHTLGPEIVRAIKKLGPAATGNPFQIIYADEYHQENIDTEFTQPVADSWTDPVPLETAGTMTVRTIPGIEAACYVYKGNPDDINDNLADVQRWVAANGFGLGGVLRMVYLSDPSAGPPTREWVLEIQHPLEHRSL